MNERIKKLAEQCNIEKYENGLLTEIGTDLEQFAELIVKECAGVVFNKVGPKSALDVLEHFGVEE